MIQWYYARKDGVRHGPVGIEELRALHLSGGLQPGDLVWNQKMKDWQPAASVPELSSNPYATPESAWNPEAPGAALEEITPGSDPIGIGTCISRGFDLTVKNALPLVVGMLIIMALTIAVTLPFSVTQALTAPRTLPPELANDPAALYQWSFRQQMTPLYFIQQAVSLVLSSFLFAGFFRICLNVFSGTRASPGQVFAEGGKTLRMAGITVAVTFPSWIGYFAFAYLDIVIGLAVLALMVLVTAVLWIRLGCAGMAVVDRDLGVVDALKYSFSITRGNSPRLLGLAVPTFLIAILGFIACFIGTLFTVPVALMILTAAYRWMQYGRRALELPPVR